MHSGGRTRCTLACNSRQGHCRSVPSQSGPAAQDTHLCALLRGGFLSEIFALAFSLHACFHWRQRKELVITAVHGFMRHISTEKLAGAAARTLRAQPLGLPTCRPCSEHAAFKAALVSCPHCCYCFWWLPNSAFSRWEVSGPGLPRPGPGTATTCACSSRLQVSPFVLSCSSDLLQWPSGPFLVGPWGQRSLQKEPLVDQHLPLSRELG